MLTKLDDYPIHQTTEPLAIVGTTDRHAYDRYWFNGYQDDGSMYFGIGAAVYPNLGILDCGFSIVHDGQQHAFHASRRAPEERSEIEVGPFRIEIIEPMKSLRVTLDDNETGISAELLWIPRTASFAEEHQRLKRNPYGSRSHMEATRFNQFGRWQGEIRYPGGSMTLDPTHVLGTKDRSWGIRPVGDPAPPGAPPLQTPQISFLWAPLHWKDRCTHAGSFDNEHGVQWHWDGMIMPTYDDPEDLPGVEDPNMQPLAGVDFDLEFIPGSRRARRARVSLRDLEGGRTEIDLEALLVFRMKGIGYTHPEWGHGKWKGELAMAGESWKIEDADNLDLPNQHIQQVMRARIGDEEGIGVLEQIHLGPHRRYGFKDFLDPAPQGKPVAFAIVSRTGTGLGPEEMSAMATISMKRAHQLEKQDVRARIETLAEKITDRIGGQWVWQGDVVVSEARGVKARVGYDEQSVSVDISLPAAMRPFRRKLETKIEEYLARYLENE